MNQTTVIVTTICKAMSMKCPQMLTGLPRLLSFYLHGQGHYTTNLVNTEQMTKRANKNRLGAIDWGPNDFDVCESNRCIGRIFLSPQSPPDRNWMWTINGRDYPRSIHSRGYSATREQAMADFKKQWLS